MKLLIRKIKSQASIEARFWQYVDKNGPNGCYIWTGGKTHNGYGVFFADGCCRAHRWLYQKLHGKIPKGMFVLHTCDNPSCVNDAHLFLGTQLENMKDKEAKGRQARREHNGNAKLTEDKVRELKAEYATGTYTQIALAEIFETTVFIVWAIVNGRTWKDA